MRRSTLEGLILFLVIGWVAFILSQMQVLTKTVNSHELFINDEGDAAAAILEADIERERKKQMHIKNIMGARSSETDAHVDGASGATATSVDNEDKQKSELPEKDETIEQNEALRKITCGCPHVCDDSILDKSNGHFSCRDRIQRFLAEPGTSEEDACISSSLEEGEKITANSNPCTAECNPKVCKSMKKKEKKMIDCGCPKVCDERALNKRTATMVCKKRIKYLMEKYNSPEEEACEAASESEPFQDSDKPCEMECNPKYCKDMQTPPKLDITGLEMPEPPFKKYPGVVIVTKVLWAKDAGTLKQMFCLLTAAYNRHVNYDILVFTTIPWPDDLIEELQDLVSPAEFTVAVEGPPLENHLESMTKDERDFLEKRCNVTEGETLTWFHRCEEKNSHLYNNVGYSWQSEFRAYHLWNHGALKGYEYMFWIDSDAMPTKPFEVDPMKVFIENDLNLMFDHFPGGMTRIPEVKDKMMQAYGKSLCRVSLLDDGSLEGEICKEDTNPTIRQVYGFHHITRLEMYKKEKVLMK